MNKLEGILDLVKELIYDPARWLDDPTKYTKQLTRLIDEYADQKHNQPDTRSNFAKCLDLYSVVDKIVSTLKEDSRLVSKVKVGHDKDIMFLELNRIVRERYGISGFVFTSDPEDENIYSVKLPEL